MRSLWGVGPAGPVHFGFDNIVLEQRSVVQEGADHTILIADVHAMISECGRAGVRPIDVRLDGVRRRAAYYEAVFRECYALPVAYVRGSDFQFDPDYFSAVWRMASTTPLSRARDALGSAAQEGSTRQGLTIGLLLYPITQVLDAAYLGVDCILADEGQRKIYNLAKPGGLLFNQFENLRQHGQRELLLPEDIRYFGLAIDVKGLPMNRSSGKTRLSIHESSDSLREKIRGMYAPPAGQPPAEGRGNALLWYLEYSVVPWIDSPYTIDTRDGPVRLESFEELEAEYRSGNLHPVDLKEFLFEVLSNRTRHMRDALASGLIKWIDIQQVRGLQ